MPYCVTLRSRTDARITGWYAGGNLQWSTDHTRQKLFDNPRDARPYAMNSAIYARATLQASTSNSRNTTNLARASTAGSPTFQSGPVSSRAHIPRPSSLRGKSRPSVIYFTFD